MDQPGNLVGSVAFGVSAVAGFIIPSTGELAHAELSNLGTFVGALCFLAGAVLLLPERTEGHQPRSDDTRHWRHLNMRPPAFLPAPCPRTARRPGPHQGHRSQERLVVVVDEFRQVEVGAVVDAATGFSVPAAPVRMRCTGLLQGAVT